MQLSGNNDSGTGSVTFRFHGELGFFLSEEQQEHLFTYRFKGNPSVKDAIEAHNVPHTEVGCIKINNVPVDFSEHLSDTQYIDVYPVVSAETTDCSLKLRSPPQLRFVADVHLGKCTRYLRLFGYDVFYRRHFNDEDIVRTALREKRIILTRDRRLLHIKEVEHGCCLHSQNAVEQLQQLNKRYSLSEGAKPFTRCLSCNGILSEVDKQSVIDQLEPKTIQYYNDFKKCDACGKIFWRGSHIEVLEKVLHEVVYL